MIDSSFAKTQIAIVNNKEFRFINDQWVNIGAFNKYATASYDSYGYTILTYDSDFNIIDKALTPIITLPSIDSDGNNIIWNPTLKNLIGTTASPMLSFTPASGSNTYTLSPTKTTDRHENMSQTVYFRSTNLPSFTYTPGELIKIDEYEIKYGSRFLEYELDYNYASISIGHASHPNHMYNSSLLIGVPAIEFLREDKISLPNDVQGIHLDLTDTNLYAARTGSIRHYTMATPGSIDTINTSFTTFTPYSYHTTSMRDVELSPDGKKMFVLSASSDKIIQYDLDSAYHPTNDTTRLIVNKYQNASIGQQFEVSYDGKHMSSKDGSTLSVWDLFDGDSSRDLYTVSTNKGNTLTRARSVSLRTYFQSYLVNGYPNNTARNRGAREILRYSGFYYYWQHIYEHTAQPRAYCFNRNGDKFWEATNVAATQGIIHEHTLSDPFNTSSITNSQTRTHEIGYITGLAWERPGDNSIQKMAWSPDGSKLFILDTYSHSLYQYNTSQPFKIRNIGTSSSAALKPLPTSLYASGGYTEVKELTEIPTVSPTNAPWNGGYGQYQVSNMKNFFFNDDGTKLRVSNDDDIFEYTLASPFDLSNITYDGANTDFSYRTGSKYQNYLTPNSSMWMADSDRKFYITQENVVYEFDLDSGLSSAHDPYTQRELSLNPLTGQTNYTGIYFNNSGHTLYVASRNDNKVYKLHLDSAYDLRDVSYVSAYQTPALVTDLQGIVTSKDETRMHLVDGSQKKIYEIDLSINFESSQYNNINYLTTNPGNTSLRDMVWNATGEEFTVIGNSKIDTYISQNNYRVIPI